MKIIYSKHANDKRILEGLSREQVRRAVKRGATIKQTDGYLASYREVKIAYKKLDKEMYYIKTIYVD